MSLLTTINHDELRKGLTAVDADGWLVFDFHGVNPVAQRLVGYSGMVTRRLFVWLPASASPTAIVHTIDAHAIGSFPGDVRTYTTWQQLHEALRASFAGRRVAMEISPKNAVPYLDRVPAGVVELLHDLGATVVPSDQLVTMFASRLSEKEMQDHRGAAEAIADIARTTLTQAVREIGVSEIDVQRRVIAAMVEAGLEVDDPPIVAFGDNTADPHHAPSDAHRRALALNEVVLLDLWARVPGSAWADQTWMAYAGARAPADVVSAWEATRDARDAVIHRVQNALQTGEVVSGASLDDAARQTMRDRGFGEAFVHRTGHSIDHELHGSGPHLDNFETRDIRELVSGVAFSVEPGVYLSGRFGMRSEVNVVVREADAEVTPAQPQQDLILAD